MRTTRKGAADPAARTHPDPRATPGVVPAILVCGILAAGVVAAGILACAPGEERGGAAPASETGPDGRGDGTLARPGGGSAGVLDGAAAAHLRVTLDRALALADSVEDLLRPVALMTPAQENELRRHLNAAHVARARALGVRPADTDDVRRLLDAGALVALDDSTGHWIVRERASAYVTPATRDLLVEVAERFQALLVERGLPPYRLELTSVLRTAAAQASLRQRNPNAAAGVSSHEFGTTADIAYEAFAPPLETPAGLVPDGAPADLAPELHRVAALALESVSARKSRELTAWLGQVLAAMQSEGALLVILERQQPVFHITLAQDRS